eukprot:scaffold73953_cov32-Tisochrysis_lutea.AAC.9
MGIAAALCAPQLQSWQLPAAGCDSAIGRLRWPLRASAGVHHGAMAGEEWREGGARAPPWAN